MNKVRKTLKKLLGHDFLGHALGKTTFSLILWALWGSKDAEFYIDFKNINLP
jgi:hypothetical protein